MKKNKLYTANKWNQSAFMPQEKNLFSGLFGSSQMNQPFKFTGFTPSLNLGGGAGSLSETDPTKFFGLGDAASKITGNGGIGGFLGGIGDKLGGVMGGGKLAGSPVGGLVGGLGSAVGGLANNLISGDYKSGAGSAISGIGGTVGSAISTVNPVLGGIVSAGSGIIGGAVNALFGQSVDEAKLKAVNEGIDRNNNFVSNAGSFDEIKGPEATFTNTDVYSDGLLASGADEKNAELAKRVADSRQWVDRSINNNIFNLQNDQMNNALRNYAAFGGPIDSDNAGAINYDFMDRYLTAKEEQNKKKGTAALPAFMNRFAFGGDMQAHGSDFSSGLTHINAGGSHSENPNDGVQMGVDNEGTPNLVEEGETVYNDYVFSNRILADEATKQMFHLPKKKDITFADISKKLEKEIAERPNDPISKAGFKAQIQTLEEQQERQKSEMEAERARAAFEALSPEEQTAVMQNAAQQEQMAQQAAQEQAIAEQQAMQQPSPEEVAMAQQAQQQADGSQAMIGQEAPMMAEGGKLFEKGGSTKKNAGTWKSGNSSSNWSAYTKNGLRDYLLMINDELAEAETEEDKKKIREKAIKTVNNIQKAYSEAYQANLTPSERSDKVEALQKAFQEAGGNAYFSGIANNINMPKGHNTADTEEKGWVDGYWGPRTSIRNWGSTEYGDADYYKDIADLAAEAGLSYAPGEYKYGDNTLYQLGMAGEPITNEEAAILPDPYTEGWEERRNNSTSPASAVVPQEGEQNTVSPKRRAEWLRYAGLFGPAVGLGLQTMGIGRPDTSQLDAAITGSGNVTTADWKPLGNYLTYRPLDIWYEQNRANALSRATDRNIVNTAGGNRGTAMAGLIANSYNSQLASGNLFRQAQEYNDALRHKVAEFNRGTDQFNAEAYNRNSQFNADAYNRARQFNAQMRLGAAREKMNADAGWYNGIYGNLSGLFKGISDVGRENAMFNMLAENAADGVYGNLGTSNTGERWLKKSAAKGGKLNKKKKGLTF